MIQGWESFKMTWLSRQQSLECSNFAHPFMLTMVRGLECSIVLSLFEFICLHKVKQQKQNKTKQRECKLR